MRIEGKVLEVLGDGHALHPIAEANGAGAGLEDSSGPPCLPTSRRSRIELPPGYGILPGQDEVLERFRFLKQRIFQLRATRGVRVVLITSPLPREGKSVVAMNLAASLSHNSRSVLLIDGDIRSPGVSRLLGAHADPGLAEVLAESLDPEGALRFVEPLNIYILGAGADLRNSFEQLQKSGLRSVQPLMSRFEWVVIDSAPLLMFADAAILAAVADATFVVSRSGETRPDDLVKALALLDGAFVAGVVLNGKTESRRKYRYSYYYRQAREVRPQSHSGSSGSDNSRGNQ